MDYYTLGTACSVAAGAAYLGRWYLQGATYTETVDLSGRVVLITGANTGIGKETAKSLAKMGAKVIIACRDKSKSEAAVEEIKQVSGNSDVEFMSLDLANLRSIRDFVKEFKERNLKLHILVANAGLGLLNSRQVTKDGFEMNFGVNHLGHFLLVTSLLDVIKQSAKELPEGQTARIVVVASHAHYFGNIHFDDLQLEKSYNLSESYAQSKIANIMFVRELHKRLKDEGLAEKIIVNAVHPGGVASGFTRYVSGVLRPAVLGFYAAFCKSVERGAYPSVFLAISPIAAKNGGGKYYGDWLKEMTPSSVTRNDAACTKLWQISEELTKEKTIEN